MGGIVIKYSSAKSRPLPLHLPLDLLSTTFSSIQQHPPDPTPNDTVKNKFFKENAKILSSKTLSNIHPELRKLRLVLGCDYGRPKMILFLTRTTPITALLDSDDHFSQSLTDHSFVYDHFISHFDLPTDHHHHHHPEIDHHHATAPPTPLYLELYLPEIIALAAIANYQTFLTSSEHSDWVKYQLMADDPRNGSNSYVSESLRSIAKLSSHRLVMSINQSDTAKLLSKTHWIVVLAHLLEEIPFAVSILGRDKEVNPSTTNKPLSTRSNHFHSPLFLASVRESSPLPPESMSILFGNSAFVDMVGSTREEIAQHPFDKYHHPHSSSSSSSTPPPLDPELAQAIHDGTSIRIGTMYHPQSPLSPFLNLQSYLPIYDPEGHCNYFLVLHCDIWKHHQNPEYLQKLDILTDLLSKTVIPHRTHEDIFLKAYFYKSDDHDHDHGMKRQPSSYQPPHTSAKYCRHEDKSATVEAFQSESGPVDPLHYLNQLNHEE